MQRTKGCEYEVNADLLRGCERLGEVWGAARFQRDSRADESVEGYYVNFRCAGLIPGGGSRRKAKTRERKGRRHVFFLSPSFFTVGLIVNIIVKPASKTTVKKGNL